MLDTSWLSRTELLIGKEKLDRLNRANVLIVGMGGVGSYAAEFICRSGIGKMTIIDGDVVDPSNRNRQLPALYTTHGQPKVELMKERLLAINPEVEIETIREFVTPERVEKIMSTPFDFVIDAIDSITPKLLFIQSALKNRQRIVSSMGAGGKMDPTLIRVVDISATYNCQFAQYIRKRLRKLGIDGGFKAVFSPEIVPMSSLLLTDGSNYKKSAFGTISYLPAAFGGACASVAIRGIIEGE